jgi:type IV pilus assembly protein PilV
MLTMRHPHPHAPAAGVSLVEVLVTVVILAFGLLGIAAFQAKAQIGALEGYQRAQAIVLLQDMRARLAGNPAHAADYLTASPLGTNDGQSADCATLAAGGARDKCEWSRALKGAAVADAGGAQGGSTAMIGARGCIEEVQARNEAPGVCQPGIYRVSVAWQGLHPTKAPALACARDAYGPDTSRRAIAVRVVVGTPRCS